MGYLVQTAADGIHRALSADVILQVYVLQPPESTRGVSKTRFYIVFRPNELRILMQSKHRGAVLIIRKRSQSLPPCPVLVLATQHAVKDPQRTGEKGCPIFPFFGRTGGTNHEGVPPACPAPRLLSEGCQQWRGDKVTSHLAQKATEISCCTH